MQRLSTRRPALLRGGRLLALAAAGLLALTGGSGAVLAADPAPNVFRVATTAGITTWDPVKSFSTEAFYLANMYEPLLWVEPARLRHAVYACPRDQMGDQRRTA